jgi:hypothetical protein
MREKLLQEKREQEKVNQTLEKKNEKKKNETLEEKKRDRKKRETLEVRESLLAKKREVKRLHFAKQPLYILFCKN